MVGKLVFKLPEEKEEFELAQSAGALRAAVDEIHTNVFRPARKNGYRDHDELNELCKNQDVLKAIALLEELYFKTLKENGVLD